MIWVLWSGTPQEPQRYRPAMNWNSVSQSTLDRVLHCHWLRSCHPWKKIRLQNWDLQAQLSLQLTAENMDKEISLLEAQPQTMHHVMNFLFWKFNCTCIYQQPRYRTWTSHLKLEHKLGCFNMTMTTSISMLIQLKHTLNFWNGLPKVLISLSKPYQK